jgi:hypothetical protein
MKTKYQTVKLIIQSGDNEAPNAKIQLEESLALHQVSAHSSHDEDVELAIDYNGSEVVPFLPLTFYDGKQGQFDERALQLDFKNQRNLEIKAKSSVNVSQNTIVTVAFKRYEN